MKKLIEKILNKCGYIHKSYQFNPQIINYQYGDVVKVMGCIEYNKTAPSAESIIKNGERDFLLGLKQFIEVDSINKGNNFIENRYTLKLVKPR